MLQHEQGEKLSTAKNGNMLKNDGNSSSLTNNDSGQILRRQQRGNLLRQNVDIQEETSHAQTSVNTDSLTSNSGQILRNERRGNVLRQNVNMQEDNPHIQASANADSLLNNGGQTLRDGHTRNLLRENMTMPDNVSNTQTRLTDSAVQRYGLHDTSTVFNSKNTRPARKHERLTENFERNQAKLDKLKPKQHARLYYKADESIEKMADGVVNKGTKIVEQSFGEFKEDAGDTLHIQNTYGELADKGVTSVREIYNKSNSVRNNIANSKEKKIARLEKQQDKLAEKSFKLEYKNKLEEFRNSDVYQKTNFYEKAKYKKFLKKKYQKQQMVAYKNAKKTNTAVTTGKKIENKIVEVVKAGIQKVIHSKAAIIIIISSCLVALFPVILSVFLNLLMGLIGDVDDASSDSTSLGFPDTVEQWREWVEERCAANNDASSGVDLTEYVDAILAVIWQETGGTVPSDGDIMQCQNCGLWDDDELSEMQEEYDWSTAYYSIDVGIRYFYSLLQSWGVSSAEDYDGLQIVAQGYNYGAGFFDYMHDNGYTEWTETTSEYFSDSQALIYDLDSYGNYLYGEEWLEKYVSGTTTVTAGTVYEIDGATGVVKTALAQEGITENPSGSNKVVYNTEYYGSEVSGSSYPWCCTFVWWCFNKSGNASYFYGGNKTASCTTLWNYYKGTGQTIDITSVQAGDIVFFGYTSTQASHVAIVVENHLTDGGGYVLTIEGNTSSSDSGSQDNGGGVFQKKRYTYGSFPIIAAVRPY